MKILFGIPFGNLPFAGVGFPFLDFCARIKAMRKEHTPYGFEKFCAQAVGGITLVILAVLLLFSACVTCLVYGGTEVVEYEADFPWLHAVALLVFVGVGAAWIRYKAAREPEAGSSPRRPEGFFPSRAAWLLAIAYLLWLLLTLLLPISDQAYCIRSAKGLVEGDSSSWEVGGYAWQYPNQNGLILFFSLLYRIFGEATGFAVQVLNIPALGLGIGYLYRMMRKESGSVRPWMWWVLALCLPFTFYITFSYGTIFGFAASMAACWYTLSFLETPGLPALWKAGGALALAVNFKSNYSIVAVALVLLCLALALARRRWQPLALAAALAASCLAGSQLVTAAVEGITGQKVEEGIPKLAWVEMGLREGTRGPGWFNFYIWNVMEEAGDDSQKAAELVREDLADTLREMKEHPAEAADFFARKIASLWSEPTFQSVWIQEVKGSALPHPEFVNSLLHREGVWNRLYVAACNLFQTFVYFFSLAWLAWRWRRNSLCQLLPAIIFLGGFLFHLVWEAKGQYSVFYFFLLVPYALQGWRACAGRAAGWWEKWEKKAHNGRRTA